MEARKEARSMDLNSCGREVTPVSFSLEGTTVFVVVGGLSRRLGGGLFAFAQSVAFWRLG